MDQKVQRQLRSLQSVSIGVLGVGRALNVETLLLGLLTNGFIESTVFPLPLVIVILAGCGWITKCVS
jgi:hypothetical protein